MAETAATVQVVSVLNVDSGPLRQGSAASGTTTPSAAHLLASAPFPFTFTSVSAKAKQQYPYHPIRCSFYSDNPNSP